MMKLVVIVVVSSAHGAKFHPGRWEFGPMTAETCEERAAMVQRMDTPVDQTLTAFCETVEGVNI